jgi:hypothetical protein
MVSVDFSWRIIWVPWIGRADVFDSQMLINCLMDWVRSMSATLA